MNRRGKLFFLSLKNSLDALLPVELEDDLLSEFFGESNLSRRGAAYRNTYD